MILKDYTSEITFRTSRSSGAGGQNVNKVSTRVELLFPLIASALLSDEEKTLLKQRLGSRIDTSGILHLTCQETRSQLKNKQIVTERFNELMAKGLKQDKKRKATKPSKAMIKARLDKKRVHSEKKQTRVKIRFHKLGH